MVAVHHSNICELTPSLSPSLHWLDQTPYVQTQLSIDIEGDLPIIIAAEQWLFRAEIYLAYIIYIDLFIVYWQSLLIEL